MIRFARRRGSSATWPASPSPKPTTPEADHLPPLAPELLDVYQQGEQGGRDDRRLLPPDGGGVPREGSLHLAEAAEEVGLRALVHVAAEHLFKAAGGLAVLVLSVLQVPTDSPMRALDDDWTGPVDQPDDNYVAVCPRSDHLGSGPEGVTPDGYWAGPARASYRDAATDLTTHGHPEAGIARCSVPDGECGLVWPGSGPGARR